MSEREVFWKIVTNFARPRRDAERLTKSLRDLDDAREDFDAKATSGDKDAAASTEKRSKATKEFIRQAKLRAKADREAARVATENVATDQRVSKAAKDRAKAVREASAASTAATTADRAHARSSAEVAAAQEKVTAANLSRQKSEAALTAAQNRLAAVEAKHGQTSQQYANQLLSVHRRQLDVESSTHRYTTSLRNLESAESRVAAAHDRTNASAGRLSRTLRDLGNKTADFPRNTMKMGAALGMLGVKIAVILPLVAALGAAISSLGGGLIALVGPIASVASAAAALPQAFSVALGVIGTFVGALHGVGGALKAGIEAQKGAGKAAKDTAKAHKDSARAIQQAQRQVRDAGEGVKEALEAEKDAQKNLTQARKDALQQIKDMQRALSDLELQERGASLSVEEARRRLNEALIDPAADNLAKDQAQLAYEEAVNNLDNVKRDGKKARKDAAEAKKKGVEGSDQVVSALKAEESASKGVRNARESLKDAQLALTDAQNSGAESTAAAATELNKYNEAMKDLPPSAQRFVRLLIGMRGEVKKLQTAAADGLLPGLGNSLVTLTKLVPLASRGLFSFGQIIGAFAERAANTLTSDKFMPMWNRLLTSNEKLLTMAGDAMLNLVVAVVYLMDAARPFTEWLGKTVLGWTEYWKNISIAGNETGRTEKRLRGTRKVLELLGGTLKNVWNWFKAVGKAGGNALGMDLLESMERITKGWEDFAKSPEGKNKFKAYFKAIGPVLHEISGLLGDLTEMFFNLGTKGAPETAKLLKKVRELVPLFETLMLQLQGNVGDKFVKLIDKVLRLFISLTSSGSGGLATFIDTLAEMADIFLKIADSKIGGQFFSILASGLAVVAALKFTGILALLRGLGKFYASPKAAGGVAAAVDDVAAAGTVGVSRAKGGKHRGSSSRSRNERGSMGFVGISRSGGKRRAKRTGGIFNRKASPETGAKSAEKMGKSFKGAGTAVTGLAFALSFLPGPIGEAAEKFTIFAMVLGALYPLFKPLWGAVKTLASIFKSAVTLIGKTLFKLVGLVSRALMMITRAMMANPWMLLVTALIVVVFLIIKYWDQIKATVSKFLGWVGNFIKRNWNVIKWFMGPMGLLLDQIIKHWGSIEKVFKGAFKRITDGFTQFVRAIKGAWATIKDGFQTSAGAIVWVINEGIIDPINWVAKKLGADWHIDRLSAPGSGGKKSTSSDSGYTRASTGGGRYAKGGILPGGAGVLPGYTPGRDIHSVYSPKVGGVALSGGEAVMRPEWTRVIGRDQINRWNSLARSGGVSRLRNAMQDRQRFAGGGVVNPLPGGAVTNKHPTPYYGAWYAADYNKPGQDYGSPIVAYKNGTVAYVKHLSGSYGNHVVINHGSNRTLYAHMSEVDVTAGQKVTAGQMIGRVGSTGNSTGPHLHFEIEGGSSPIVAGGGASMGGGNKGNDLPGWMRKIIEWAGGVKGWISDKIGGKLKDLSGKVAEKFGAGEGIIKLAAAIPKKLLGAATKFLKDKVPGFARGGVVPGRGQGDTVPAMLTPGEFVVKRDAVRRIGVSNLHRMNGLSASDIRGGVQHFATGGLVRSGTFNAHTYGHNPKKTIADLKKILPQVDSLALQEWTNAAGAAAGYLKKAGFGLYRGPTGTAIAYRRSRFRGSNFGAYDLNTKYRMPKRTSQRYAAYGLLTDKQSGKRFWQTSAHLIPGAGYFRGEVSKKKRDAIFNEQRQRMAALVKRLRKTAPVITGGDFNSRSGGLVGGGMKSELAGKSIDQIYSNLANTKTSRIKNLASDHDAFVGTYKLGTAPTASTSPTPAPAEVAKGHGDPTYGSVLGMKRGAVGPWVRALQRLTGQRITGRWDEKLDNALKRRGTSLYSPTRKWNPDYKELNKKLQIAPLNSSFTKLTQAALTHVLAHAYKRKHGDFDYRPWQRWSPVEAAIISQNQSNANAARWQKALETIGSWGFEDLISDLYERGIDDGLPLAESAAKNKTLAGQLNEAVKVAKSISDEDFQRLVKMVSFLNSNANGYGLRDIARHLGLSDFETVRLWENGTKANKLTSIPAAKRNRVNDDVKRYRMGTFYANTGGQVPGTGSGDTVPAMLTPGEFVVRKQAAQALGLDNLWAINNLQKFASGGPVLGAPKVSSIPTKAVTGVSSRRLSAGASQITYTTTYDVDIINPVAEPGTRSMLKMLQRQSALGKGGNSVG